MLSNIHLSFLHLVRLGIGHSESTNNSCCEKVDWDSIKALADRQCLSAVLLDGLLQLPKGYLPPEEIVLQLIGRSVKYYECKHNLYRKAIAELAKFYNDHGFKMMVLKGYACAIDWPKPEHRPTGDIDIWLFGQQAAADKELDSWFKIHSSSSEIDSSHHHHTVFNWQGFTVENHYDFINVHARKSNVKLEKIFKELGDECHIESANKTSIGIDAHCRTKNYALNSQKGMRIPWIEVNGERVYLPSANLHALFLIRHMVAHFAADRINLRQVLDWAFFVEKHGKEVDWKWLLEKLDEFGLRRFFDVINVICVEDLNFSAELFPYVHSEKSLKQRVLGDILEPEFNEEMPTWLFPRLLFRYRRWQANHWKQSICYKETRLSVFCSGIWSHLLKPKSI